MKRRIFCLATTCVMGLALLFARVGQAQSDEKDANKRQTTLTVDYGDGAQKRYLAVPWRKSMTVLDALTWADQHPHGIEFVVRGQGETALVTQIDDLKNGVDSDKNWIFRVNGKLGDRSCGVFPVQRGDTILWRFEKYQ